MSLKQIKKKVLSVIKLISTILIISALGWELGNIYAALNNQNMPSNLNFIFWIGRFALVAHLIEGIIATVYASSKNKAPIQYGIYTFFVGTVGLWELFIESNEDLIPKAQ
ncbi:hypothetical protein I8751_27680 [Nostocaceae cyanobacterium CENA357]|uniref:Uncharacterized protein n=1 Tax=Atlanticothrix silvestris CENA357 TaxID=1725252 RepID=A0A8J7L6U0_9CYAN|nr:hypothetical protein [Atlanticothrix silvestris]MBH8556052.1 hypothetical protein [Atlanticothrix silvestris CENA357]